MAERDRGIASGNDIASSIWRSRLRYEISRQLAPYVGISHEAKVGRTADFARADGEDSTTTSLVASVRLWS